MRRGTRVVVTLPNGDEAAARFCSQSTDGVVVQVFGENRTSTTDQGYRTLPVSSVQIDAIYAPWGRK